MRSCVSGERSRTCCPSSLSSHPLPSPGYHQVEASRASKRHKTSVFPHERAPLRPVSRNSPCHFCVLQTELHYFRLLPTKGDTQTYTAKCEQNLHTCPILTIRKHVIFSTFTIIFSITCLSRAWEAPEKPDLDVISTDPWRDCN